jgi:hypothetical protein
MMSLCDSLNFLTHKSCKEKIQSLNSQIILFVNQIQELKAINDYQNWELEKKIVELEKELALLVGNK